MKEFDYWDKKYKNDWLREHEDFNDVRKNFKRVVHIKEYLIAEIQDTAVFEYPKVLIDSQREIKCILSLFPPKYVKNTYPHRMYKYSFYIDSQFNGYLVEEWKVEKSKVFREESIFTAVKKKGTTKRKINCI